MLSSAPIFSQRFLWTWQSKSTNSELLSINAKSFPSCCTMLTSAIQLTAASLSVASITVSSSAKNFVLTTNQFFKKPTYEGLKLAVTIRWCGNGQQDGETSGFESSLSWSPSERFGCARYRCCRYCCCLAALTCPDLLAPICQPRAP